MNWKTRLVPALSIGLVAALLAGATMAAVSAGSSPGSDSDEWVISMGALGDRGTYRVHTINTQTNGTTDETGATFDFGWTRDTAMDPWGRSIMVDRLDTLRQYDGASDDFASRGMATFLPGATQTHSVGDARWRKWETTTSSILGGSEPRTLTHGFDYTVWGNARPECLLGSAFAGMVFHDGETVQLEICQSQETTTQVERSAGQLVLAMGDRDRYVFQEGIPYPIELVERYHVEFEGVDVGGITVPAMSFDVQQTWTLTGYTPGDVIRAPVDQDLTPPKIPTKPLTASMLDDEGLDHPFPLSVAFQAAMTDVRYPDFREFMDNHADAYLAVANYQSDERDGYVIRQWHLTAVAGVERIDVIANQTHLPNTAQLPGPLGAETGIVEVGPDTPHYGVAPGVPFPPRSTLADRLPSSAWLLDQWTTMSGEPGEAYGFGVTCGDENCTFAQTFLSAGNVTVEVEDDIPIGTFVSVTPPEIRMRISELTMDETGKAYSLMRIKSDSTTEAVAGSDQAWEPPASQTADALLASFVPITPTAASGASAVGIVAGLAYYLWPALKSGGLAGLFSRVETSAVAQHPMRRRILDAVAAEPGIHHNALQRKTGIANGALLHHLGKLSAAGDVVGRSDGRYTCYFLPGTPRSDVARGMATRSSGAQAVLGAVTSKPGVTAPELAQTCGIRLSTAQYHTAKLCDAGLVKGIRDGRVVRWHATSMAGA